MVVASAGALLATSDPDKPTVYVFETSSEGPRATLSASKPKARYLLRARAIALGPEQIDTTESASATVHGSITSGADADAGAGTMDAGASPFVRVSLGSQTQMSDQVSALSSFQVSRSLRFTGNCAKPDQGTPCQAELELDLNLEQPAALLADGSVNIDWSVAFEARAFAISEGRDVRLEAPWTVEIIELAEP